MTCRCPKHWCYRRDDCRHWAALRKAWKARREKREAGLAKAREVYHPPTTSMSALRLDWLKQRRDELLAGDVHPGQEGSLTAALLVIEQAIRRYEH